MCEAPVLARGSVCLNLDQAAVLRQYIDSLNSYCHRLVTYFAAIVTQGSLSVRASIVCGAHCVQAYIGFRSSIWSFNPVVAAWEPVMEPWDIILQLDVNPTPLVPLDCLFPKPCCAVVTRSARGACIGRSDCFAMPQCKPVFSKPAYHVVYCDQSND